MKEDDLNEDLDQVLKESKELDRKAYTLADTQAKKLYQYLMDHPGCTYIIIDVGERIFELDIWHTEVLNEIYTMLTNLTKLNE